MTGAHIVTWKLNRARLSFLAGSKDMSNAFWCGSHRPMNDRILARHSPGTALILNARRLTSCVQITAPDGYVVARIGSGGMQGDGNAPDEFWDSFRDVIEGWRDDTLSQRTIFTTVCAVYDTDHGSLFKFVDDLLHFLVVTKDPCASTAIVHTKP